MESWTKKPVVEALPARAEGACRAHGGRAPARRPERPGGDLPGRPPARRRSPSRCDQWVKQAEVDTGQSTRDRRRPSTRSSRSCARRTRSCAGPTISCKPQPVFLGRSSTADARSNHLHRRPPRPESGGCRWGVEPICEQLQSPPPPTTTPRPGRPRPGPSATPSWPRCWWRCGSTTIPSTAGASSGRRRRRAGLDAGRDQVARLMRRQQHAGGHQGEEALHHQGRSCPHPGP